MSSTHISMALLKERRIISQPSSPIHRLPFELLGCILYLALVNGWGDVKSASPQDVLVVCRVCSHWRQVALNTLRLWILDNFPIMNRDWMISTDATKMFLKR